MKTRALATLSLLAPLFLISATPSVPSGGGPALRPAQGSRAESPGPAELIAARFHAYQTAMSPEEIRSVARAIERAADREQMSWEIVLAVIHTESGFHCFAVSRVGALGLMQIMPPTGQDLAAELGLVWDGPDMLFRPVENVEMGTRYLASLYARYGDWDKALAAYNWGPARIDWRLSRGRAMPVRYVNQVYAKLQSPAAP